MSTYSERQNSAAGREYFGLKLSSYPNVLIDVAVKINLISTTLHYWKEQALGTYGQCVREAFHGNSVLVSQSVTISTTSPEGCSLRPSRFGFIAGLIKIKSKFQLKWDMLQFFIKSTMVFNFVDSDGIIYGTWYYGVKTTGRYQQFIERYLLGSTSSCALSGSVERSGVAAMLL